jgi:cyclase
MATNDDTAASATTSSTSGGVVGLAQGVYAWLAADPGHGHPNAGAVIDADGVTVIDTLCTATQAEPFAAVVDGWGLRTRRIVLTGDHIEFVGGTVRFPMAAVYGSPAASAHLDQPPSPAVYRRLHPTLADQFDDDMRTRPVSHIVDDVVELTPAVAVVPTAGQSSTNLVALVPESDVLFAGAMCCFGVTPLAFDGDPAAWADALEDLGELATTIVPGHGPVGGMDEVRRLQRYLRACVSAAGDPSAIPPGPWDAWPGRRWDEVNVERAAMLAAGDRDIPPSMLRAVGLA